MELFPLLLLYPTLTPEIFIADMFHTIADVSSIIFDLFLQFFANTKVFELERLHISVLTDKILHISIFTDLIYPLEDT